MSKKTNSIVKLLKERSERLYDGEEVKPSDVALIMELLAILIGSVLER